MIKKISIIMIVILSTLFSIGYSAELSCDFFESQTCPATYEKLFSTNGTYNSVVQLGDSTDFPLTYTHSYCCRDSDADGVLNFHNETDTSSCTQTKIFNATNYTNGYVYDSVTPFGTFNSNGNLGHMSSLQNPQALCGEYDTGRLEILWIYPGVGSVTAQINNGFHEMFKVSNRSSGKISNKSYQFDDGTGTFISYEYSVMGKLTKEDDYLNCNFDCTSTLDGRVYDICKLSIPACANIPDNCNGAILGTWVQDTPTTEVQCSGPWNNRREISTTTEPIEVTSVNGVCRDLIKTSEPVFINNEVVIMHTYICNEVLG